MDFLNARDTINGGQGTVVATIVEGNNRVVEPMFYLNSFEASIELEKEEFKALGSRVTQHKVIGWTGSGSMNISYITSKFRELVIGYTQTGYLPEFKIVGTNHDETSSVGAQSVQITGVTLNGIDVFKLDKEAGILEEDLEFTFTGVELLRSFEDATTPGPQ